MPTETPELRARIRERIEDGRLPIFLPAQYHGGYGTGSKCAGCDQPIDVNEVEYEVTEDMTGRRLSLHLTCHVTWQIECLEQLQKH